MQAPPHGQGGVMKNGMIIRYTGTMKELRADIIKEVPTPDLIAELEKRRPCERCAWLKTKDFKCLQCVHQSQRLDNFKETTK